MPFVGHARAKDQLGRLTVASSQSNPASRMSRTISTALRHRSKSRVCSELELSFFGGFMDALCSSFGWDIAQLSQNSAVSGYRIPRQKARDLSESAKRFVGSCDMNGSLQSIVSKRLMSVYNSGPSKPGSRSKKFGLDC